MSGPTYPTTPTPPGQWDPSFVPVSGYGTPRPRELPLSKAAITSLVLSIPGVVVLSIIFGIVGLSATANGTRRGRGFAWAGLAISTLWIVALVGLYALHQSQQADRGLDGQVQNAGTSDVFDLQKGDCLDNPASTGLISDVKVLPCTQSHTAQVVAVVTVTYAGTYDEAAVQTEAQATCRTAASAAITTDDTYDLLVYYPRASSWSSGDRTAICLASSDTPLTSSVIGS